jgi:hypothetical protein
MRAQSGPSSAAHTNARLISPNATLSHAALSVVSPAMGNIVSAAKGG